MIANISQEKDKLNNIIASGLKEIIHKGLRVYNNVGDLEDDCNLMMRALQAKNRIYDYACIITANPLFSRYEGKIVYSLVDTSKMGDNASDFEEVVDFVF